MWQTDQRDIYFNFPQRWMFSGRTTFMKWKHLFSKQFYFGFSEHGISLSIFWSSPHKLVSLFLNVLDSVSLTKLWPFLPLVLFTHLFCICWNNFLLTYHLIHILFNNTIYTLHQWFFSLLFEVDSLISVLWTRKLQREKRHFPILLS